MGKNAKNSASAEPQTGTSKLIKGARFTDAILAVVFSYLAYSSETTGFQIFWALSAVLCVATAIKSPIEKIHSVGLKMILSGKRG